MSQILVDDVELLAVCLNRLGGSPELSSKTVHMRVPAELYHVPVGLIPVHRDLHSSAARGYHSVERSVIQRGEKLFELVDIGQRRRRGDVAPVEEDMAPNAGDADLLRLYNHLFEVADVRVDVAVGEESDKVHCRGIFPAVIDKLVPRLGFKHLSAFNRLVDELCAL